MASCRVHLFKKYAVAAGTPRDYYINPSEMLMSRASEWSAVEHEDCIELAFPKGFSVLARGYIDTYIYDSENKMDFLDYIMNTDFLTQKGVKAEMRDGVFRTYYPKINFPKIELDEVIKKKNNKVEETKEKINCRKNQK
ncbi:hypothetical protein MKW94_029569 [Papaver nudicaule]|uniref:Uncharacterized protein n=1 Tax=Papaver nudicaule TaxID=74823 RepID=A0AA41VRI8_PAPNU|nr:hypothetical protein [Papaver nudicaule]